MNPEASGRIPAIARSQPENGPRAFVLQAHFASFTPGMYVDRAFWRALSTQILAPAGGNGTKTADGLRLEIESEIERLWPGESEEARRILLEGAGPNVFVLLPPPAPTATVLDKLAREYPTVTFVIRVEPGDPIPSYAASVEVLRPQLPTSQEKSSFVAHDQAKRAIERLV